MFSIRRSEKLNPAQRRYLRRFFPAMTMYVLVLFACTAMIRACTTTWGLIFISRIRTSFMGEILPPLVIARIQVGNSGNSSHMKTRKNNPTKAPSTRSTMVIASILRIP